MHSVKTTKWTSDDPDGASETGLFVDGKRQPPKRGGRPPAPPRAKAPTPQGVKALAWLWCDPLPPVPVGNKPLVQIGRSRDCDMILAHEAVSRVHAKIRVAGEQIVIEDNSTYGTSVNGERVVTSEIKPGDLVAIGPYVIMVRESREQRQLGEAATRPLRLLGNTSEAMGGRLEKVPMAEVLQSIEFNEKTGTLKVFDDVEEAPGILVVYSGSPMFAEWGELRDDEAVFKMLGLARGNFSFVSKVEAGEKSMAGKLTKLLFDFGRQQDEATESAESLPPSPGGD